MQINPTLPQDEFIFSNSQFPAFVGGFGSGKTEALIVRSIIGKINNPTTDRAFYEPTYDLIRMIAWPRFEEILSNLEIPYRLHKSPINVLHIEGCGKIIFRSMDVPQRIIGYEVGDSDVDELDTLKKDDAQEVWRRILSRNRQKKAEGKNTVAVATTPEGFKFVYDLWEVKSPEGYEIIRAPTYSNPHLPDGYIESLKDTYPEQLIDAYIEGKFVNLTFGSVYKNFQRDINSTDEQVLEGETLYIGQDFNVGEMASVVAVRRVNGWHAVDELVGIYDTPQLIDTLINRYPMSKINIYPDASGRSRKTVDASKSDIALLEQAGLSVRAKKQNPPVKDRILAVNGAFDSGKLYVNLDKCPNLVKSLEQQTYDKNGEPDKTSGLDHNVDALGYFVHYEMPIVKPVANISFDFAV